MESDADRMSRLNALVMADGADAGADCIADTMCTISRVCDSSLMIETVKLTDCERILRSISERLHKYADERGEDMSNSDVSSECMIRAAVLTSLSKRIAGLAYDALITVDADTGAIRKELLTSITALDRTHRSIAASRQTIREKGEQEEME